MDIKKLVEDLERAISDEGENNDLCDCEKLDKVQEIIDELKLSASYK